MWSATRIICCLKVRWVSRFDQSLGIYRCPKLVCKGVSREGVCVGWVGEWGGGECMGIQSEPGEESASVLLLGCVEVMRSVQERGAFQGVLAVRCLEVSHLCRSGESLRGSA